MPEPDCSSRYQFLSTPSARRATLRSRSSRAAPRYFYPRPPRGGRQVSGCAFGVQVEISIHALREEGDTRVYFIAQRPANFYPRPPRGGRRLPVGLFSPLVAISIHALREEGDHRGPLLAREVLHISIHALREEGDPQRRTSSAVPAYFYPRPPRGGRRIRRINCIIRITRIQISIHALREEGDAVWTA